LVEIEDEQIFDELVNTTLQAEFRVDPKVLFKGKRVFVDFIEKDPDSRALVEVEWKQLETVLLESLED